MGDALVLPADHSFNGTDVAALGGFAPGQRPPSTGDRIHCLWRRRAVD